MAPMSLARLQLSAGPTLPRRFSRWRPFQRGKSCTGHLNKQRGHGGTAETNGQGVFGGATPTPNLPAGWRGGGGPEAGHHSGEMIGAAAAPDRQTCRVTAAGPGWHRRGPVMVGDIHTPQPLRAAGAGTALVTHGVGRGRESPESFSQRARLAGRGRLRWSAWWSGVGTAPMVIRAEGSTPPHRQRKCDIRGSLANQIHSGECSPLSSM